MKNNNEMELRLENQALHYLRLGRYQQAAGCLHELLATAPENAYFHYLLAHCYYGFNEYPEAKRECQAVLAMNSWQEETLFLLGKIYLETKEYIEAEKALLAVLKLNSVHAEAMAVYGYLMFKTGHEKKGLKLLDEATRLAPENDTVLHYNFIRYLAKNEMEEQLQIIRKLMLIEDNEIKKLLLIGMREYHTDHYRAAYESFRQAFVLDPTNETTLSYLKSSEQLARPWMQPLLWVEKLGGGSVLWLVTFGLVILFYYLKQPGLVTGIAITYLVFAIYSWIVVLICKLRNK